MPDNTARRIRYGRLISVAFGLLCVALGLNGLIGGVSLGPIHIPPRWDPAIVTFPVALRAECWFFIAYAVLLFLPWRRIENRKAWNWLFALLCFASVLFAFTMICEVMAKNYIAQNAHLKAKIPVFQAVLLFLGLGQIPIELFSRKPELLD
jgi:4-amino-4-deoxy-L-arabinose transferase-like glycosyltransferase